MNSNPGPLFRVVREVEILRSVNDPNIIGLETCIFTRDHLYIALELAKGGEQTKMIGKHELDESLAKKYFQQLANAIDYLHSRKICHRYLKLENISRITTIRSSKYRILV